MAIDKELYRNALEHYRQWNEAEMRERMRNPSQLTPQEAWRQYAGLWHLLMKIAPPPSRLQEKLRATELELYYERVKKMEQWRRARGRTS